MQDVKIIDIDSTQWNIKDQEARNRIANLENVTIPELKNNTVKMVSDKIRAQDDGTPNFYIALFQIKNISSKIKPNSNVIFTVTYSNKNITQTLFYDGENFTPSPQNVESGIFYYLPQHFALYISRSSISLTTDIMVTLLYTEK